MIWMRRHVLSCSLVFSLLAALVFLPGQGCSPVGPGTQGDKNTNIDGGGNRTIAVLGNPYSDADCVVFSGNLTNIGTLTVKGNATYSFSNSPGELRLNGNVAGNVNVTTGAALGGTGTITGNLNVSATGIVAPGDSVGTLNVDGSATLSEDSIYEWQVGQPDETDILDIFGR